MSRSANTPRNVQCEGWWEQAFYGRQPMQDLQLQFSGSRVAGTGVDVIGLFTFVGTINESGYVALVKRYVGQHAVKYLGLFDGEGTIQGQWHLEGDSGPWFIKIKASKNDVDTDIPEWTPQA